MPFSQSSFSQLKDRVLITVLEFQGRAIAVLACQVTLSILRFLSPWALKLRSAIEDVLRDLSNISDRLDLQRRGRCTESVTFSGGMRS